MNLTLAEFNPNLTLGDAYGPWMWCITWAKPRWWAMWRDYSRWSDHTRKWKKHIKMKIDQRWNVQIDQFRSSTRGPVWKFMFFILTCDRLCATCEGTLEIGRSRLGARERVWISIAKIETVKYRTCRLIIPARFIMLSESNFSQKFKLSFLAMLIQNLDYYVPPLCPDWRTSYS